MLSSLSSRPLAIGFNAAQVAALPSLVQRDALVAANGRMIAGLSAASISGPVLAGGLVHAGLDAGIAAGGCALVPGVGAGAGADQAQLRGELRRPAPTRLRQDIADGLRYVWRNPLVRAITLLLLCLNSIGPTARIQLLLFAKLQLGASDAQVGMLWSAAAVGVLLGSLLVARLRRWSIGRVVIGSLLLQGLLLIVFAQMRGYWPALLLWGLFSGARRAGRYQHHGAAPGDRAKPAAWPRHHRQPDDRLRRYPAERAARRRAARPARRPGAGL